MWRFVERQNTSAETPKYASRGAGSDEGAKGTLGHSRTTLPTPSRVIWGEQEGGPLAFRIHMAIDLASPTKAGTEDAGSSPDQIHNQSASAKRRHVCRRVA